MRLTQKSDGKFECNKTREICDKQKSNPKDELCCCECDIHQQMIDKLGEYEDAEEQGLILRLPFKIGQKVYYIYASCIDGELMIGSMIYSYSCLDFPREYFATKSEAEAKLEELRGVELNPLKHGE